MATVLVNYVSFGRVYRITTLLGHPASVGVRRFPRPGRVLKHHLLMMAVYMSRPVLKQAIYYGDHEVGVSRAPGWFTFR